MYVAQCVAVALGDRLGGRAYPADQVAPMAVSTGAIPYDVPDVELTHVGPVCSFDAFLKT